MTEDSKGRLWIATNNKGVFVYEKGEFTRIETSTEIIGNSVRALCEDSSGNMIVGSTTGLALVNEKLAAKSLNGAMNHANPVISLACDMLGRVWCVTQDGELFAINGENERIVDYDTSKIMEKQPLCVDALSDGRIAIGTNGGGVLFLTAGSDGAAAEITKRIVETPEMETINAIYEDKKGNIWLCCDTGAALFSADGKYETFVDMKLNGFFCSMTDDYEGNYWLASSRGGVLELTRSKLVNANTITGLTGVTVNATMMYNGELFAATDSGVRVFDKQLSAVEHPMADALDGIRVRSMYVDSKNRLWFCTYKKMGVVCWDGEEYISIGTANGLASEKTRQILELRDGSMAVATSNGISFIRDMHVAEHIGAAEGLSNEVVLCMLETSDGRLLAGTDGGGIFQIENDRARALLKDDPHIADAVILRMAEDEKNGCLWVGGSELIAVTKDGARHIDDGCMLNGSVFDIQFTNEEILAMYASAITVIDRDTALTENPQVKVLNKDSGLTGNITSNSWHCRQNDTLYISTGDGVYLLDISKIYKNVTPPKVIINEVVVDGRTFVNPSKEIKIDSGARSVTIDIAVLSFTPEDAMVEYYLEGFDEAVTQVKQSEIQKIRYTNLDGGKYVFHLSARNYDGMLCEREKKIVINKALMLSEQAWFAMLVSLCSIALVVLLAIHTMRVRTRRILSRQEEYREITRQSLLTTANVIDARDKYTNGHSRRVALFAKEVCRRMKKPEAECENVYFAALLHDIGKIGIPDSVLNKPGKLTPEEFEIMKSHAAIGGEILKNVDGIPGVADGAACHHERLDGSGYPKGLSGEQIPYIAQIISVGDSLDAMTSNRIYRPRLSNEKVIAELKNGSGTQFNEQIVTLALDMLSDGFWDGVMESEK